MALNRHFEDRQRDLATLSSPLSGPIRPYAADVELQASQPERDPAPYKAHRLPNLDAVFEHFEVKDGSTLSFHHHFRNGDRLINAVLEVASRRGLKDLTIAPSSLFPVHGELAKHVRDGVIANILTDYMKGDIADTVTDGHLQGLALLQSHGGRARAIASGQLKIDVAFVGASVADETGAATGRVGQCPCGPLGYAMVDAAHASNTVIAAHEIVSEPLQSAEIPGAHVDAVVPFQNPGLTEGISFGATVPLDTPSSRMIGSAVVDVVAAAGLLKDGFSFQSGAGGYSLGAVPQLGIELQKRGVVGGFISGGIASAHVDIVKRGLAREIRDVQSFDSVAVHSSGVHAWHKTISAAQYASPLLPHPTVNELDLMLLGAIEIDRDFNVNVVTGGDGRIFGGPGGHPDTAFGAKLSIVTTGLVGGGYAKLVDQVRCVSTPGDTVDVLITDDGLAVNPQRTDLQASLIGAGQAVKSFDALLAEARARATRQPEPITSLPCALVEARDGRMLDVVYTR